MRLLLQAPTLTSEQVAESFIDVCNDELNDKGKRLVRLLSENKRIILLTEIARIYENLRAQQEKSLDVEVITPYEISSAVSDQLAAALKSRLQREVKLVARTDERPNWRRGGASRRYSNRRFCPRKTSQVE